MTPSQMGDGSDESDTFVPGPAVALWSHISGRRRVRVPEIVHGCRMMNEQRMRT